MNAPPHGNLSILQHLIGSYKSWHEMRVNLPKSSKYTLGEKIDTCFIKTIELIFIAQYLKKEQKLPALQKANTEFDVLKLFLRIIWEFNDISAGQYAMISEKLVIIGNMLGAWLKRLQADTAGREVLNQAQPPANTKK